VIGDLNDGMVSETARSITEAALAASSARVVPAGTVLIAMYGSIGKLGIAGVDMATNQAIGFAHPLPVLEPRYLFWYLRSQRGRLGSAGKGATQKNISQTVLKAWSIPLPPLNEQRRIVAAIEEQLSRLDAADALLSTRASQVGAADLEIIRERPDRSPHTALHWLVTNYGHAREHLAHVELTLQLYRGRAGS